MSPAARNRPALPLLVAAVLATAPGALAQDRPPPIDPALRSRFGFRDPIIKKLGRGTNMLQAVQWTATGPVHILVNNPFRAQIDDLRLDQRQVAAETISTDGDLRGLVTADIDGDGRRDILMLTARGRLVCRLSDPKATPIPEVEVGRGAIYDCMRTADLDRDDKPDVLVLTRDGLRAVTRIGPQPVLGPTDPVFARNVRSFDLTDIDGDDRADVVVCAAGEAMQVHAKLGGKDGFGPWILLDTPQLLRVFPGTGVGGAAIATIHDQPRRVIEYAFETTTEASRPALLLTALPETIEFRPIAYGDVDNDGDADIVLADARRARLTMLLEDAGRFRVDHTPTLAGVRSLALGDADGDGKIDLVLASAEERSLAWVPGGTAPGTFPKPMADLPAIGGEPALPIAVTIEAGETLVLLRNKSMHTGLYRVRPGAPGTVEMLVDLGKQPREPHRLLCADLDGRCGTDIAYVLPNEGLQVLFRNAAGKFDAPRASSAAGFTKQMEDHALSLTGSGTERALLAVRERYTRRFRFDAEGRPEILSQDNGPEGNPSMAMGAVLADGARLFLDRQDNRLYRMAPDLPTVSTSLPKITPTNLLAHGQDAVVVGRRGVLRVPFGRGYRLRPVRRHEPPTRKTRYYTGIAADLDGDGTKELALADDAIHGIHILVAQGDKLRRGLSFPVFESTNEASGQPRALATGDVDSDGLHDLLLLAHDRILIYSQER